MALLGALAPCAARAVEPAGGPSNVLGLIALATAAGAGAALAGVALAHRLRRNHELQRLQAQLAASVDWTWRIDGQGRLTELAARRPGAPPLDPAALLGRRLWQLLDTRADAPQALEAALAARQPFGGVLLQAAGRVLLLAGAPIPQGGCAGTAIDVGALLPQAAVADPALAERTRRLELTARELDSFAYSVSHDLRAPLRVVDGFANILLEDYADAQRPLDDLGREHIRRIVTAGNRMNAMIDTLLSMSRMTAADLTRERVDLTHLAQELADELRASDRSRRVQFVIAENLTAEGDRTLLRLVRRGRCTTCATTARASTCALPTSCSDFSSGFTRPTSSPAPALAWPRRSASCASTAAASGPPAGRAKAQRSSSRSGTTPAWVSARAWRLRRVAAPAPDLV